MPTHRIAPPQLSEYTSAEVAAMLPPMRVPSIWFEAIKVASDKAMRLALDSGVAIRADYKFLNQHESKSNGS